MQWEKSSKSKSAEIDKIRRKSTVVFDEPGSISGCHRHLGAALVIITQVITPVVLNRHLFLDNKPLLMDRNRTKSWSHVIDYPL